MNDAEWKELQRLLIVFAKEMDQFDYWKLTVNDQPVYVFVSLEPIDGSDGTTYRDVTP